MYKVPPMSPTDFDATMARIHAVCGTRTQMQLAEALGVRQSSISDAKRRKSIPAEWLLKLVRQPQANPDWLLTGQGPEQLAGTLPARVVALQRQMGEAMYALADMQDKLQLSMLLASMTNEELAQHKQTASTQLGAALQQVIGMSQKLQTARQGTQVRA